MNGRLMSLRSTYRNLQRSFRHGRFVRSIRPADVFLVTYPKSGTMWVGFLLANILQGLDGPPLNLRTYLKYVPDINDRYFEGGDLSEFSGTPDPRFFSSHAPYDRAFPRVVYVLRDPRDVMVSYWHHTKLLNPAWAPTFEDFILGADQWPGPWDEHVRGWVVDRHQNVLVARYEDLKVNTLQEMRRILDFVHLPCSEEVLGHAIREASFENMKALEMKFGSGRQDATVKGFVRSGRSGNWRDEVNQKAVAILEKRFGPVMKAVGYRPTADEMFGA